MQDVIKQQIDRDGQKEKKSEGEHTDMHTRQAL